MTCRRAFEADLAAVLHGEGDPEFRAHAETCAECAAELHVWRELDGLLHAGALPAGTHPEPEALVAFVDAPGSLAPDVRATIERHVAGCRACADEARAVRRFDGAAFAAASPAAAAHASPAGAGSDAAPRAAAARGWVGRVLWHPVFAYALVVLLAVPLLRDALPKRSLPRVTEETQVVDARRAPPAAPKEAEAPVRVAPGAPVAAREAEAPRPAARPAPSLRDSAAELAARRSTDETDVARPAPAPEALAKRDAASNQGRQRAAETTEHVLADTAPGVATARRASGAGVAAAPLVLELRPQQRTVYDADVLGRSVTLRVTPPGQLAPGPLAVTVRGRADRRELTVQAAGRADAIALDMPAGWLAPGDYVVTLQPLDGGAPALLGFSVRAPAGAR